MTGERKAAEYEELENRYEERRKIRKKQRERERLFRVRLARGMLCLCMVVVCVGTVVLASDLMVKNKEKASEGNRGKGAVRAGVILPEDEERRTAEVKRPLVDLPEMGALYKIHVQGKGWSHYFADNSYGMAPAGGYITAVQATLHNQPEGMSGTIEYKVNLSGSGWLDWQSNAHEAGGVEGEMPLEAVCIRLTGELAEYYDVLYSVNVCI